MAPQAGRYVGVLPKPRPDAGPITMLRRRRGRDSRRASRRKSGRSWSRSGKTAGDKPVAALGPADPVQVFSVNGGTALPAGFFGVSSVVAGGASDGRGRSGLPGRQRPAAARSWAAPPGSSWWARAAVGVGTVVIVSTTGGSDNPPVSPSR